MEGERESLCSMTIDHPPDLHQTLTSLFFAPSFPASLFPSLPQVEEEVTNKRGETTKSFVNTKLMTRQTYTLDGVSGEISVGEGGKIKFVEKDGIDYAATTVQLPGGERVPFLFTIKELTATAGQPGNALKPGFQFGGSFKVY